MLWTACVCTLQDGIACTREPQQAGPVQSVAADDANKLARAVVQQGPLGRNCQRLLVWLLEAADSTKQTLPTVRAKAIKALGIVAEVDPALLAKPSLQACINKALGVSHPMLDLA